VWNPITTETMTRMQHGVGGTAGKTEAKESNEVLEGKLHLCEVPLGGTIGWMGKSHLIYFTAGCCGRGGLSYPVCP